jgi:hypothetical protein
VAASKVAYWSEQFAVHGSRPAWEAANALLVDIRRVRPDFPSGDDRAADVAHHVRMCSLLTRAAHAFTGRPPAR